MNESELSERLEQVQGRIRKACDRAGREPDDITLLGVSKFHGPEAVAALARRGVRCFGESRVQEARVKIPQCPGHIEWHMVGHLQTNKCRDAVGLFKMIQSVDRLEVAEELQRQAEKRACTLSVLLEVNVAGESSKFGWSPDALKREFLGLNNLERLEIHGLMTIAPYAVDPEKVRPYFRKLRELRDDCADLLGAPLPVLSMGMSGDLEVAIEEGSTCVRVGTALFGARPRGKAM